MKIYVLRHGETDENITGMLQGNMDTLLNEKGRNQAKEASKLLEDKNINLIISSPKRRTLETAHIAFPNMSIMLEDRLLSRDHGEFQGKSRNEINLEDYWNINKNIKYVKAESVRHMYDRIESLLNDVKEKCSESNVLLVTHSGICRILYYYFNGIPADGDLLTGYQSKNCSVEEYEL